MKAPYLTYLLGLFCYLPCVSLLILKVSYLPGRLLSTYLPTYLPTLLPTYVLIGDTILAFKIDNQFVNDTWRVK
jgi:hypothetical protein